MGFDTEKAKAILELIEGSVALGLQLAKTLLPGVNLVEIGVNGVIAALSQMGIDEAEAREGWYRAMQKAHENGELPMDLDLPPWEKKS